MSYTEHTEYRFEVMGDEFAVHSISEKGFYIKETSCNGQEDSHFNEWVYKDEYGEYVFETGEEWFEFYGAGENQAKAVLNYIKEHGLPTEEAKQ